VNDIRYSDDNPDDIPEIAITRTERGFTINLTALRQAVNSGSSEVRFTTPEGYRFGADRHLHPENEADRILPWHKDKDWSGWLTAEPVHEAAIRAGSLEVTTLNLAPAPWIDDPDVADHMIRALSGAIATAAACGHVTRLASPDGVIIAEIGPPSSETERFGQELRRGMAQGHPLVTEAARLAAEPRGVQEMVLASRADLRALLEWAGYGRIHENPGSVLGRLTRAAFPDPVDDTAGLSAYSCQVCGHIAQPQYWHDTSSHTSIPDDQCAHPQAEIDDDGVCQLCDEAVEGPALDALVLNEIARLVAGRTSTTAAWQLFGEISSLVQWTGRNGGPQGPGVRHSMRAGIYTPDPDVVEIARPDLDKLLADAEAIGQLAAILRGEGSRGHLTGDELVPVLYDIVGLAGHITDSSGDDSQADDPRGGQPDSSKSPA
jgi:hypothetical protein